MIEETVRHLYELLVDMKYIEIESMTAGKRMRAAEIKDCIDEYGLKLIPYPRVVKLDIIAVHDSDPREWSVIAPIYTAEEGCSDLSLEMSLTEGPSKLQQIELDNIHVR